MLWLPNRGVRHQLKFKEAAQLGGFFVFETRQTRQLDETRWGQTSLYSTRGQTSSRLDSEVNKGADFFEVKLRSDSKMGGQRWGGRLRLRRTKDKDYEELQKLASELKPTNQKSDPTSIINHFQSFPTIP